MKQKNELKNENENEARFISSLKERGFSSKGAKKKHVTKKSESYDLDFQTLKNMIKEWNPDCENITLSTIFAKIKNDAPLHVINSGMPGTGKSRSSLELIKRLDPDNTIILDNTTTDRGLFEVFQEFPNSDIILDECSTLLRSLKTQDMIKLCMEGKPITWTKKDSSETTEPFTGTIIINTNMALSDSVNDRCLYNEAVMNRARALNFLNVFASKDNANHELFFNYCKNRILDDSIVTLSDSEFKKILNFVNNKISVSDDNLNFSRRIIIRQINYFKKAKKFFKVLSDEVFDYLFKLSESYITNNHTPGLIEHLLSNGGMDKPNLVKAVSKQGGYSETHARRLINESIKNNELILKGKRVELKKKII